MIIFTLHYINSDIYRNISINFEYFKSTFCHFNAMKLPLSVSIIISKRNTGLLYTC